MINWSPAINQRLSATIQPLLTINQPFNSLCNHQSTMIEHQYPLASPSWPWTNHQPTTNWPSPPPSTSGRWPHQVARWNLRVGSRCRTSSPWRSLGPWHARWIPSGEGAGYELSHGGADETGWVGVVMMVHDEMRWSNHGSWWEWWSNHSSCMRMVRSWFVMSSNHGLWWWSMFFFIWQMLVNDEMRIHDKTKGCLHWNPFFFSIVLSIVENAARGPHTARFRDCQEWVRVHQQLGS